MTRTRLGTMIALALLAILLSSCGSPDGSGKDKATAAPDTGGPVITVINPADGALVSGVLLIAGVAADVSDVSSVVVSVDGAPFTSTGVNLSGQAWSYPIDTLTDLTLGAHTVSIQATDVNGNDGAAVDINFTVNHEYPSVTIASPVHGAVVSSLNTTSIDGTAAVLAPPAITSVQVDPGSGSFSAATGTASWTQSFDPASLTPDGDYTIRAVAYADNGNSALTTISVTVDATPPVIDITSHNDGDIELSGNFTISGTATDANTIQTVEIRVDSGSWETASGTGSWSYNLTGLSDAPHLIEVAATDAADNTDKTAPAASITVYVDATPPTIAIDPPAATYISGSVAVTGNVTNVDGDDTLEISFDDGATWEVVEAPDGSFDPAGTGDFSFNFDSGVRKPADGSLTPRLRATAAGGGDSGAVGTASVSYIVDNSDPTGSITAPGEGAPVYGTIQITGTASDGIGLATGAPDGASLELYDDTTLLTTVDVTPTAPITTWSYNWDTTSVPVPNIALVLTDRAGNSVTVTRAFVQDTSVPAVALTAPAVDAVIGGAAVTVSGTASDDSGVSAVNVWFDSEAPAAATYTGPGWTYSADVTGLSDGTHTLTAEVTAVDLGTSQTTITVTVDNTAPVVAIAYPTDANVGTSALYGLVSVTGTASDTHLTSVDLVVNGTPVAVTGSSSWSYDWDTVADPLSGNGVVVSVTATDEAGNVSIPATATVEVRPHIESLGSASVLAGFDGLSISGNNFDPAGTLAGSIEVLFDGVTSAPTGTATSLTVATVPALATSGDVVVSQTDGVPNTYASGGVHLDVWALSTGALGGVEGQAMAYSGGVSYQALYADKDLYFSLDGAAAAKIDDWGDNNERAGIAADVAVSGSNVYVSYLRKAPDELWLATSTTGGTIGSFSIQQLAASVELAGATSVATDGMTVGVVYQNTSGELIYLHTTDGSWTDHTPETVDSGGVGQYASLAYNSSGVAIVAYYDETDLEARLAHRTGGSWTTGPIDLTGLQGEYISLAVDSADGLHVSYYDGNSGDLVYGYAATAGSSFALTTVDSVGLTGGYTAIMVDGSDDPHIAYVNLNFGTVQYAGRAGAVWQLYDVPASAPVPSAGTGLSLGFDSSGDPVIGLTSGNGELLTYRR